MRTLLPLIVAGFATLASNSYAATSCAVQNGSVVCTSKSNQGKLITLGFDKAVVSRATEAASLCSEPSSGVTAVKLWMPEHNHGTSDPNLRPNGSNCVKVEGIEFIMAGLWQFRVSYQDGDAGVIDVQVAR